MRQLARRVAVPLMLLLALLPTVALAGEPPGADSPQALVARMQKAAEQRDMREMISCLAPDARREMTMVMLAGAGMMIAFMSMGSAMADAAGEMAEGMSGEELGAEQKAQLEKGKKEAEAKAAELTGRFEAILDRHGVTAMMEDDTPLPEDPEQRSAALAKMFAKTDEIALFDDVMGLLSEVGESKEGAEPPSPIEVPQNVTDYQIDGDHATAQAGDETLHFVRIDGRWYGMPDEKAAPAATAN